MHVVDLSTDTRRTIKFFQKIDYSEQWLQLEEWMEWEEKIEQLKSQ